MEHTGINATQVHGTIPSLSTITPDSRRRWDRPLVRFLQNAGLLQALRGFENDMLVMNQDSEKTDVLPALEQLHRDLTKMHESEVLPIAVESKLEYAHVADKFTPVSSTQLRRSIAAHIAQNKARNNISNRNEFLKARFVGTSNDSSGSDQTVLPTCARTDAVPVNRDVQMKYDVAKNEDGPLRRTLKLAQPNADTQHKPESRKEKERADILLDDGKPTLQLHPGLAERFATLEDHLTVRYAPSPPASLLDRIRFLEDYIIRLERDYPPWAALHFNQPNRGWPPPPRPAPIIVPPHLTSAYESLQDDPPENRSQGDPDSASFLPGNRVRGGRSRGSSSKPRTKGKSSSLHRAVMRKLEVKAALAEDQKST